MEGSPDKDIEQILKFIFPTIENGIVKAVSETVKKAAFFVTFEDFQRYMLLMLQEHVRLSQGDLQALWTALEKIYIVSHAEVMTTAKFDILDSRAIQYALKLHDFYLGNFFQGDIQIRQRTLKRMADYYLKEGNPIGKDQEGIRKFKNSFGQYLKEQADWKARQIVDTSVNYLRNSAKLRAMQKAKIKKYRWDATGDRLTCAACRSMDGRVFELEDAIRVLDTLEGIQDPALLKELRPIITTPQRNISSSIPTKFPPLHPFCRCRVVIQEEEIELPVTVETPSFAPKGIEQRELEEQFKALTKQEIANRIKAHQGSDWLRPSKGGKGINAYKEAKKNLERHFKKHGSELGYSSIDEYKKGGYNIIKNSDSIYVEKDLRGGKVYHFIKDGRVVVSDDDNLKIKSFYPYDEERWRSYERAGLIKLL